MLLKHFERVDTSFRPVPAIRNMTTFRALNLATTFDVPAMDVVFLRNVLIYFDTSTKVDILARVRKVLRPDGYLFLGGAETTLGLDEGFDRVTFGKATAYRLKGARPISSIAFPVLAPVGSPSGPAAAALATAARR
jgi:chemotaxis protein methyltransferase CheR